MTSKVTSRKEPRAPFVISEHSIAAGTKSKIELPIARLMSGTPIALPVMVLHGKKEGPSLWLTAAVHGDELCGVEIIRRVLEKLDPRSMAGSVVAVPVVNVHGFIAGDRYLPDRRDLNRSFPGSPRSSLASRIAHLMMTEVINRCDIGIDLHTGSDHRTNLPQIRADLSDGRTMELTRVFGAPVAINSQTRDGSLRQAATESGSTVLLFEGGEANRFDEPSIRVGSSGVLRVLEHLGITKGAPAVTHSVRLSYASKWVRASKSGLLHLHVALGDDVMAGDKVATIHDTFGTRLGRVFARSSGLVIGLTHRPLVNRGDAILHLAELVDEKASGEQLDDRKGDDS